jgi:methionyl-tRNA formyltransferase
LLVVAAYGQILSREVLAVSPGGGINVHASLLPKYRGAAPIAWAIFHGETQTGVTIIRMSVALDAGDMLAQETIDILPDETAGELEGRLAPLGAKLALEAIARMEKGPIQGVKQDKGLVTKAPKLTKQHGIIDWERPADAVVNQIRAMQPWPTAFTYWHRAGHEPLRLLLMRAVARTASDGELDADTGEILINDDLTKLHVRADEGVVEVLELQPAGKKRMSSAEFMRGRQPHAGDRLGPEAP